MNDVTPHFRSDFFASAVAKIVAKRFVNGLGLALSGLAMLCWLAWLALFLPPAQAQLIIDVTTSAGRQIPIALVPFANEATAPQNITPIIGNNLARTGLFSLVSLNGIAKLPVEPSVLPSTRSLPTASLLRVPTLCTPPSC